MQRAIDLALLGQGDVAPNPLVGAVLVHQDRIIGEGYHARFGGPHAEVNAFAAVSAADQSLVPEATLYVSLEPCAHQGKTPPCTELILSKGVKQVVVACLDPFPAVNGKGVALLRAAGTTVTTGVLANAARQINAPFFHFQEKQLPLVTLKWAQSADGFMAAKGTARTYISGQQAQDFVQGLRAKHMAILVGYRTAFYDNPLLTNRSGKGQDPLRIVVDPKGELPPTLQVFQGPQPAWRFQPQSVQWVPELLQALSAKGIQSLLVEGGKATLDLFLAGGFWDRILAVRNQHLYLKEGLLSPQWPNEPPVLHNLLGEDEIFFWAKDQTGLWPFDASMGKHV